MRSVFVILGFLSVVHLPNDIAVLGRLGGFAFNLNRRVKVRVFMPARRMSPTTRFIQKYKAMS